VINGPLPVPDLKIHLYDWTLADNEQFEVLVSSDGTNYVSLGQSGPPNGSALQPKSVYCELAASGLPWVNFIKIQNVITTPGSCSEGPDIDAIEALNGLQSSFSRLCFPGTNGVINCPCGQLPNSVGGCANFGAGATSGAKLLGSGVASLSADSVILTTTNHRTPAIGVLNVFFGFKPGTITTGTVSGAGVRCTSGGDLRRFYTVQVLGGVASKPGMGDPSVSARSAAFPSHAIVPGQTRYYFNTYRDGQASGPCGSTAISTNLTNMVSVAWGP